MAGQVPMTPPPAYAQQFGQMLQQTGANRANVLGAELESQSANLGHILGNITKIAEVGGGEFTPDRLLASYAGSKEDQIDDRYSGMADRLRLAEQQAKIAALGRSGRGGGGMGSGEKGAPGEWLVRNKATGEVTRFDPADKDTQVLNDIISGNSPALEVLRYGTTVGVPEDIPTGGQSVPNTTTINGITYDNTTGERID